MQNLVFTQLSVPEVRQLFRQELETFFDNRPAPSTSNEEDEILTIQQASAFLNLSVSTIYSLVSKGEIPVSKRGKRLYFSKLELKAWIKTGYRKTQAEIATTVDAYLSNKKGLNYGK